jgi:hypothetical protein
VRAPVLLSFSLSLLVPCVIAQTPQVIQQAVEAKYSVSKPTADHKDIVTSGAVIDLTKDGLVMFGTDVANPAHCTYKNGKFEGGGMTKTIGFLNRIPGNTSKSSSRTFVGGEKFFLIGDVVTPTGVTLEFLSDPFNDLRYRVFVTYPFPGGGVPSSDAVLAMIGETIKAEAGDNDNSGGGNAVAKNNPGAASAPPPAPMADIPPPPPPTDAPAGPPPTISVGQKKDDVIAAFGQPTKTVKLGAKEIDYFPGMKVTFTGGKVSNVE